jgi:hypothetical protein
MLQTVVNMATGFAAEFWVVLAAMAPYLLFGFLVAGFLSIFISADTVEEHLGGGGFLPVLKAAAFGVPLPLCSCGVIPVAASLRRHGASRGATTAFMLSTPQTGVDSILVTYSLLGPVFAVFRPVMALISGILGGTVVSLVAKEDSHDKGPVIRCTDECCMPKGRGGRIVRALRYGFRTLPRDISKALLVGLVIAGAISAIVPKDFFGDVFGKGILQILVMMALGIPVYVCATASVPVAAALIAHAGVSPGAAMAFLITGPATNAATIATVWKTMGKRTAFFYLLTVAVTAFGSAVFLDYGFPDLAKGVQTMFTGHVHEHGASTWGFAFDVASVAALLGVLGVALFKPTLGRISGPVMPDACKDHDHEHVHDHVHETLTFAVEGMTCSHCVETVTRALSRSPGVESANVDLDAKTAVVHGHDLDAHALARAVESVGYKITSGLS